MAFIEGKGKKRQVIFRDWEVRKCLELRMRQRSGGKEARQGCLQHSASTVGAKAQLFYDKGFRAQRRFSVTFFPLGFLKSEASFLHNCQSLHCFYFR